LPDDDDILQSDLIYPFYLQLLLQGSERTTLY